MTNYHQNENATDSEARTNQANPSPPPLPVREESVRKPSAPLRSPKDSR